MRELRNIVVFSEVASCMSFSKAAKNLCLTPSAVSMSIQKLEDILGTRLLNRTTRQLHLTMDGSTFLEQANEGLSKIYEAVDLFKTGGGAASGVVRVSIVSALARSCVLPALSEFATLFPGIRLEIGINDRMPDLIGNRFDIGTCYGEPADSSYIGRYLCTPAMTLVASPAYLAANGTPGEPDDLRRHQIVNSHVTEGANPSWTIRQSGASHAETIVFQPTSHLAIIQNHDCALDAAVRGLGIALVTQRAAEAPIAAGHLVPLLSDFEVKPTDGSKIYLLYPSKQYLPARVRAVIDFLVDVAGRECWDGAGARTETPAPLISVAA